MNFFYNICSKDLNDNKVFRPQSGVRLWSDISAVTEVVVCAAKCYHGEIVTMATWCATRF